MNVSLNDVMGMPVTDAIVAHPELNDFFEAQGIEIDETAESLGVMIEKIPDTALEDAGTDRESLVDMMEEFLLSMAAMTEGDAFTVNSLTLIGGFDKSGTAEDFEMELRPGDVVCIVGPTGSGKSRLLADIEWMAMGDTPTKRRILVNGSEPEMDWRYSPDRKLVAQLSQNMNFVMDLSVKEFLHLHAESRLIPNAAEKVEQIIVEANRLAGEPFSPDTPVTSLSGGQSRALMIADVAFLSSSPVVLVDEIENAGIDRAAALKLLTGKEKIVLMATHDPVLALMGSRRLVIKNGGVSKIIETTPKERQNLEALAALDARVLELRNRLRRGEMIEDEI